MKKNFIQDVIPANHKRSIRDIPLPAHKKRTSSEEYVSNEDTYTPQRPIQKKVSDSLHIESSAPEQDFNPAKDEKVFNAESFHTHHSESSEHPDYDTDEAPPQFAARTIEKHKNPRNKKTAKTKIIFIGAVVIFLVLGLSIFGRSQAIITIEAKQDTYEVNSTIPLTSGSSIVTTTQITRTASRSIPATSEQQIEQVAQGQIRIINRNSQEPQDLITNTRFEAPNGLIYRIREAVRIPGYTLSGSTIVPGTLEVIVYADEPGEEYNITSATNFTIPGFSGMEQFDTINAELVDQITGGFMGIRKVVSEEEKEQTEDELRDELESQFNQLQKESSEYIILPQLETLRFSDIKDEAVGDTVTLSLSATIDAYSLTKQELSNIVGQNVVEGASSEDAFIIDSLEELTYEVTDENIEISGESLITWDVDTVQLKNDLVGKKRSEMERIVNEYPSFEKSSADIKPFWKRSFPDDVSKIQVIIAE